MSEKPDWHTLDEAYLVAGHLISPEIARRRHMDNNKVSNHDLEDQVRLGKYTVLKNWARQTKYVETTKADGRFKFRAVMRVCDVCGTTFVPFASRAKRCSLACRQQAHRLRSQASRVN